MKSLFSPMFVGEVEFHHDGLPTVLVDEPGASHEGAIVVNARLPDELPEHGDVIRACIEDAKARARAVAALPQLLDAARLAHGTITNVDASMGERVAAFEKLEAALIAAGDAPHQPVDPDEVDDG